MAKKRKNSGRKKRLDLLSWMKNLAAFLFWLASFILVILQICEILKSW